MDEKKPTGATVRHRGPFSDLPVPRVDEPLTKEFFSKYVRPLYMARLTEEGFAPAYERLRRDVRPETVAALLAEFNWRPRRVAALFAAIEMRREFEEPIGNLFLRSDVCCVGDAYCMALAAFDTERSREYLRRYLDHYLTTVDLWFDQPAAMAAVAFLDTVNGTREIDAHMPAWNRFVADKPSWNLPRHVENFARSMEAIARLRREAT